MAGGGVGDYELNIDIDWSNAETSTNEFISQITGKIEALRKAAALPVGDPNRLDESKFIQETRTQVEVVKRLAHEMRVLGDITKQQEKVLGRAALDQGRAAVKALYGKSGTNQYRDYQDAARARAAGVDNPNTRRLAARRTAANLDLPADAVEAAQELVQALKTRLGNLKALIAIDKAQKDRAETSVHLLSEINALERQQAAAVKAATANILRKGGINKLARLEAQSNVFDRDLQSRVDLNTSGALAKDPRYAERLAHVAVNERAVQLRKQLEFEIQVSKHLGENVRLVSEETQLRRARLAAEKRASLDFSANPALGDKISRDEAQAAINKRIFDSRTKAAESDFFAGDSADARTTRDNEAATAYDKRITALKKSLEEERLFSVYLENNADEVLQETALRRANNARLKANEAKFLGSKDPLAKDIRDHEAQAALDSERNKIAKAAAVDKARKPEDIRSEAEGLKRREIHELQRRLLLAAGANFSDQQILALSKDESALRAEVVVAERRVKDAKQREAKAALAAAGIEESDTRQKRKNGPAGRGGRPSIFQRVYGRVNDIDPNDAPSGRKFIGSRALSTAAYGLSGGLLYGSLQTITSMVKEAEELEKVFNRVRSQFEAIGKPEQFQQFRTAMLDIAKATGSAASEVTSVGFQLQGAFGGNTLRAITETEAAFKAVRVTGLEIAEVIDAFTALTESFGGNETSIESLTDKALGLQERFGVMAKETIAFASDLAPVAAQMGFTAHELEALGATAQKYSGRSGSSLAEAFSRILPQIQENGLEFASIFQQIPALAAKLPEINEAFASGNIRDFFVILAESFESMDAPTQNYVLSLLGGRRETAALVPVLRNAGELLREFSGDIDDTGKNAEYFTNQQQTLGQKVAEFGEALRQLGVAIYDSGLGDFLKLIADSGFAALQVLEAIAGAVGAVGGALNDISPGSANAIGTLIKGIAAYATVRAGARFFSNLKAGVGTAAAGGGGTSPLGGIGLLGLGLGFGGPSKGPNFIGRGTAAYNAARSAGAGPAVGLAGGIKGAFAGVSWLGLGAAVGVAVIAGLSAGVNAEVEKVKAANLGADGVLSEDERGLILKKIGKAPDALASGEFDGYSLNSLKKKLSRTAFYDNSWTQQYLDTLPGDLSSQVSGDQAGVQQLIDSVKEQGTAAVESILNDEKLLAEFARVGLNEDLGRLKSLEDYPDGSAQFTGVVDGARDKLDALGLAILDGSANTGDILRLLSSFDPGGNIAIAMSNLEAQLAAADDAKAKQDLTLLDASEAKSKFDSGELSLGGYRASLEAAIANMRAQEFDKSPDARKRKQLDDTIGQFKDSESNSLIAQAEALIKSDSLQYGSTPQQDLDRYIALLKGGKLNQADQDKAQAGALKALEEAQAQRIEATDLEWRPAGQSADMKADILSKGTAIPEPLRVDLIEGYLKTANLAFQDFLFQTLEGDQELINVITASTAALFAQGGYTLNQAERKAKEGELIILKMRKAAAQEHYEALAGGPFFTAAEAAILEGFDHQIEIVEAALKIPSPDLGTAPPFDTAGVDQAQADALRHQAAEERRAEAIALQNAQFDFQIAAAQGDPVKLAQIAIQRAAYAKAVAREGSEQVAAQAAYLEAQHQLEDAYLQIATAMRDLAVAKANDDPIKAAKAAVDDARQALANAHGVVAQAEAQAALIRAQHAQKDAILALADAQTDILIAQAEAVGDSVKAAKLALDKVNRQLARTDLNTTQRAALQGEQVRLQTAVGDAMLSEQRSLIEFQLSMGTITKQQAIAALEGLLQLANSDEEVRDLLLAIKSLKDDLGADFQFNLPTELGLPTLYEARRLDQSGGTGSSYQDNRTITVTLYASTDADPEQIATAVATAVGEPNRIGTYPSRY